MTTQSEKVRKLRALARSPNKHEAALALAKAQALEARTARGIAHAIVQLLIAQGITARARPRSGEYWWPNPPVDATVQYYCSRSRRSGRESPQFEIQITEYEKR